MLTTADAHDGPVFVAFAPAAVTLHGERPAALSASNVWRVTVAGLEMRGDLVRVDLTGELPLAADLTPASAGELALHPGTVVWATVKAAQLHTYPA